MERVIITIDQNGNATAKAEGHPGPGCKNLTKAVEKALGNVTSDKHTSEYTEEAKESAHVSH